MSGSNNRYFPGDDCSTNQEGMGTRMHIDAHLMRQDLPQQRILPRGQLTGNGCWQVHGASHNSGMALYPLLQQGCALP